MRRLMLTLAALAALAVPAAAQNIDAASTATSDQPYVQGLLITTMNSFDGSAGGVTEPAVQGSIVGRLPIGSRLAFAGRLDSLPQSGSVPFNDPETWYSGQLGGSVSFEFARGSRWQAGVHATGALTYALSDLEDEFGRSLAARPKLWFVGPYVRDGNTGAFAYAGIGSDQLALGDRSPADDRPFLDTFFATASVPFINTATIRVDVTIPIATAGSTRPHAGRLVAGIGIPVFAKRAQ